MIHKYKTQVYVVHQVLILGYEQNLKGRFYNLPIDLDTLNVLNNNQQSICNMHAE